MQAAKYTVTSKQMLDQVYRDCDKAIKDFGFIKVEWKAGSMRSINQNDLYWMWLGEIAHQTSEKSKQSFSKEDLHDWLREEYLGYETKIVGKKEITALKSTTQLTKGEMYFYMQQVDAFAHSHGFKLTIPEDSEYMNLKRKENE